MSAGPEPPLSCDLRLNHAAFSLWLSEARPAFPGSKGIISRYIRPPQTLIACTKLDYLFWPNYTFLRGYAKIPNYKQFFAWDSEWS